jgi:flagellar biogenesis protein FliO
MEQVWHSGVTSGPGEDGWAGRLIGWIRRLLHPAAALDAPLRIEARLILGPRKSLVLVSCCGRRLLLSLSGDAVAPLLEIPKATRSRRAPQ